MIHDADRRTSAEEAAEPWSLEIEIDREHSLRARSDPRSDGRECRCAADATFE
jgi:hypothetical protein